MEKTKKIITLTLNPAFDIHCFVKDFSVGREHLAKIGSRNVGGKGLNVSRALNSYGVKNTAVILVGKENGKEFLSSLKPSGLDCVYYETEGRIRENVTIHDENGVETRISFLGFSATNEQITDILNSIEITTDTVITFTGRLPSGVDTDVVKQILISLKEKGVKIVIDSKSFTLKDMIEVSPWLIKPNQEELSEFFGEDVNGFEMAKTFAKRICADGIENVMVSLGEKGALLCRNGKTYIVKAPKIEAVSTIGAGDSSIAGFISAYVSGKSYEDCLKTAVAFGSASCLTEGTTPPNVSKINEILLSSEVISE